MIFQAKYYFYKMKTTYFIRVISLLLINCIVFGLSAQTADTPTFGKREKLSRIKDEHLDEISGIVESISNPYCYWVHNDSGDDAVVYLINKLGYTVARVHLVGGKNRDWEDIAIGKDTLTNRAYVFVGDIGDNLARHNIKQILRFEEPVVIANDTVQDIFISDFCTIHFDYSDGKRDAESLMFDPISQNLYVFSKREKNIHMYELPAFDVCSDTIIAVKQLTIDLTYATAADISLDGTEILLKNYSKVLYWKRHPAHTIAETMIRKGEKVRYIPEPQGEAICWTKDGNYITVSEKRNVGEMPFLFLYRRK